MKKFDIWNYTVLESDKKGVIDCIESEIEMFIDDNLRVYDENMIYIADAIDAPEIGIGIEYQNSRY